MKLGTRYLWGARFFSNIRIASLPPLTRIFLQGLWCAADREGRLEDCPRQLKVMILPYDDGFDAEKALRSLEAEKFIVRYQANGVRAIQVLNWEDNGKPFTHEKPSKIPPVELSSPTLKQPSGKVETRLGTTSISYSDTDTDTEKEKVSSLSSASGNGKDEIEEVFQAFCRSWGKTDRYELTPQRARWIANAIHAHGKDGALRGVKSFRADPWPERKRNNDLKYLFGDRARIDKWCSGETKADNLFPSKPYWQEAT